MFTVQILGLASLLSPLLRDASSPPASRGGFVTSEFMHSTAAVVFWPTKDPTDFHQGRHIVAVQFWSTTPL